MFKKFVSKIVGDPNRRYLDRLSPTVEEVNNFASELDGRLEEELRAKTASFRERLEDGETLEDILPEAYALVREASEHATGLRHYDVQIMGGILLHRGEVVEMRTGEGKTLVATLPLYLNALTGKGAHLVTVNDYLARRDGGWMGKIYHLLGLTVGCIGPLQFSALYDPEYVDPSTELEDERLVHWRPCTRQEAYQADITYGTSSEFGFDYLRDNMVRNSDDLVQRDLHFAVIDEVDNVLIDEARTPLIIAGPVARGARDYVRFSEYVRGLKRNTAEDYEEANGHYDIDEKSRSISLTDIGIAEIEKRIPEVDVEAGESLYDPRYFHLTFYLDNALKAQYLFRRDQEYVVQQGAVIIVDDTTGRLMPGRRYSDGLHEAIEAKEKVQVRRENVTVATITIQNYFRLYDKIAGMTGTAMTDAEEFAEVYEVEVTPLPTNVQYIVDSGQMGLEEQKRRVDGGEETYFAEPATPDAPVFFRRNDFHDQIYSTEEGKDEAIVSEIKHVYKTGRPVLVGTTSVEHSELIHRYLRERKIPHSVLNAKQHQREALTVAQAGREGAVTISTSMAGRGTDILLGGNPEALAAEELEEKLFDRKLLSELARRYATNGVESALAFVKGKEKLSEDLVEWLGQIKAEFEQDLAELQRLQVLRFLAQSLQEPYAIDYEDLVGVLRLVRDNELKQARDRLNELDVDVALVTKAQSMWDVYSRYLHIHQDEQATAQFFGDILFERHYNARAALIREVLSGDRGKAEELTRSIPGLSSDLIEQIEKIKRRTEAERQRINSLGGLHVIGSERHESRRIDNQLRGRAARQGDPGSSRFFLSLEDDLMIRFGGERLKGWMGRMSSVVDMPEDMPIEHSALDKIIENSQQRIEGYNFDMRKNVLEYDDVMSKQRRAIYAERRAILEGKGVNVEERVDEAFGEAIEELAESYLGDYLGFVQENVDRAIGDYSTDATDALNVFGVLYRLRGLLPGIAELSHEELTDFDAEELSDELMALAEANLESGYNLYQLLGAARRFIPLLPAVPNLRNIYTARRGSGRREVYAIPENKRFQDREQRQQAFLTELNTIFDDFLAAYLGPAKRQETWEKASERIGDAFTKFNVSRLTDSKATEKQQVIFQERMDDALRHLLLESLSSLDQDQLVIALVDYARQKRQTWREFIGDDEYQDFVRLSLLNAIDSEWREYLVAMDDLRREIGLEAFAQRDPKVEYKRRSFQMFTEMRSNIDRIIVDRFFRDIAQHQQFVSRQEEQTAFREQMRESGYQVTTQGERRREMPKVGRNDPCPCGSGKKYKQCHMRLDRAAVKGGKKQTAGVG
jgi:preprotein translocase subunit SecA